MEFKEIHNSFILVILGEGIPFGLGLIELGFRGISDERRF